MVLRAVSQVLTARNSIHTAFHLMPRLYSKSQVMLSLFFLEQLYCCKCGLTYFLFLSFSSRIYSIDMTSWHFCCTIRFSPPPSYILRYFRPSSFLYLLRIALLISYKQIVDLATCHHGCRFFVRTAGVRHKVMPCPIRPFTFGVFTPNLTAKFCSVLIKYSASHRLVNSYIFDSSSSISLEIS